MAEQQRLVLNLSDFPISEVQSRNVEGIRSYARSVRNKHAYGAASVLFFIANQIEAQTKPPRPRRPPSSGAPSSVAEEARRMREAAANLRDDEKWDEYETPLRLALADLLDRAADIRTTIDLLSEVGAVTWTLDALDEEMAVADLILAPDA